VVAEVTTASFD